MAGPVGAIIGGLIGGGAGVSASTTTGTTVLSNTSTSTNLVLDPGPHAAGLVVYPNTTPFQNSLPAGSHTSRRDSRTMSAAFSSRPGLK